MQVEVEDHLHQSLQKPVSVYPQDWFFPFLDTIKHACHKHVKHQTKKPSIAASCTAMDGFDWLGGLGSAQRCYVGESNPVVSLRTDRFRLVEVEKNEDEIWTTRARVLDSESLNNLA